MTKLSVTIAENRLIHGQFGAIRFGRWGIECSDRQSFVTLTDRPRNVTCRNGVWQLSQGRLHIALSTEQSAPDRVSIRADFTALADTALQDAVVRLVFDRHGIAHGIIGGKRLCHRNSDKYRLFPVSRATLVGRAGEHITITLDRADGAGRFAPYLYLRDRDDHWICHARLLPTGQVDQVWLRWANRFFTCSAPDALSRRLWQIAPLRDTLWRLRERKGRRWPEIQAVPLNILKKGHSLSLEVTCHFH